LTVGGVVSYNRLRQQYLKGAAVMNLRSWMAVAVFAGLAMGQGTNAVVMPYDSLMADRVSVDGFVDREEAEYPAHFADKATGITVSWGHDDSTLFLGLETRGRGWLAVGLGSDKMNESNMFVGFYSDDSQEVYNQVGAGYGHADAAGNDSLEWEWEVDRDDETGVTTMEIAYPLHFPTVSGLAANTLEPGKTYGMILAQNSKSISLKTKHTHKSVLNFTIGAKP
jgi:hypothetical protein